MSDNWIDVLQPRRRSSDLLWLSFHNWFCAEYRNCQKRNPVAIRDAVLEDPTIKALLRSEPGLSKEISTILEEMAHTWSLKTIRFVGYFLTKVMKSIYRNVWVSDSIPTNPNSYYFYGKNNNINTVINGIAKDTPILYMPTHRSYADFLLFSYVCFHFNLPLPSIAAGNDFLSLNQVASLLRACGAFFIRRSFKNDAVYWHVFRAYVQTQIKGGERPMEFFVEGTRSRSGKFLSPKIGLLSVALELFLTAQITDLVIIPVSMSYDRTLEEQLYAKELAPPSLENQSSGTKPKETPRHLLRGATSILSEDYGSVYVRFGEPISIKEMFAKSDLRKSFSLVPRDTVASLGTNEHISFISRLAADVIYRQRRILVISSFNVFSLCAFSEMYIDSMLGLQEKTKEFSATKMVETIEELATALDRNCLSYIIFSKLLKEELIDFCKLHNKFIGIDDEESIKVNPSSSLVLSQLRHYSNQALQLLVEVAICCLSESYHDFEQVQDLLSREFVFKEIGDKDDYELASALKSTFNRRICALLAAAACYYVQEYLKVLRYLAQPEVQFPSLKPLIKDLHTKLKVPLDIAQNANQLLHDKGILTKSTNLTIVNVAALEQLIAKLEPIFETCVPRQFTSFLEHKNSFKSKL